MPYGNSSFRVALVYITSKYALPATVALRASNRSGHARLCDLPPDKEAVEQRVQLLTLWQLI
jgi:hypothetical protein